MSRFVESHLGVLLGRASQALYKDFDDHVRAAGLSPIEWRVLAALHDGPPITISALAREVLAKQPTVTKLVQRMCEQGWLRLQADAADQRRTLVAATAAGRKLARPLVERARAHEATVLSALGARQGSALKAMLAKLADR